MKQQSYIFILLLVFFSSCLKDSVKTESTFTANVPITVSKAIIIENTIVKEATTLTNPGKIYVFNSYLFVSEKGLGVHIIDNSNPSNPINIAFIQIPGNIDIAVDGNYLFADSFKDLLTIDISNPTSPIIKSRLENVFDQSYIMPNFNNDYPVSDHEIAEGEEIVSWRLEEVKEVCKGNNCFYNQRFFWENNVAFTSDFSGNGIGGTSATGGKTNSDFGGRAGSMTRFMIYQDNFYAINSWNTMKAYKISTIGLTDFNNTVEIGRNIETLFTLGSNLFVGAQTGLYIYDLTNPVNPIYISQFNHATACDPVVVFENYAYVTLRGGNNCGGWGNQLDIINISDLTNPTLDNTIEQTAPYGLGVDGYRNVLFVCDNLSELKVYDISSAPNLVLIDRIQNVEAFDVIPLLGNLIVSASNGIFQYDYTDVNNINLLSQIPIAQP